MPARRASGATGSPSEGLHDLFVIGGGINGCGIARDAAGRGFSVFLAEKDDLASGTSSRSTKLIHGGLRYLEYYEIGLVRKSLKEREILWAAAPHIIRPLRFVLPHHRGMRPAWMLRLGLFLYDHIGGRRRLAPTTTIDLRHEEAGKALKPLFRKAFEYSDCGVDDARLVVLTARDAADRGAVIRPRTEVIAARRENGWWRVGLRDARSGAEHSIRARLLVNAAGPWVDEVIARTTGGPSPHNIRLVQGSHIVVDRLFDHERCYIFQNTDGRIIFAIPYEEDYTLIGTTDRDYRGDPDDVAISAEETAYLCAAASEYFVREIAPSDVRSAFSGIRPLFDDGASKAQEATRDYVLKTDGDAESGMMINLFGGKITTYRLLSETVLEIIEEALGRRGPRWTARTALPGGDFAIDRFGERLDGLAAAYPFLDRAVVRRLFRQYGTRAHAVLAEAKSTADLGRHFGQGLFETELRYLTGREWAMTAEDILWRRTKLGLKFTASEAAALDAYLAGEAGQGPAGGEDPDPGGRADMRREADG